MDPITLAIILGGGAALAGGIGNAVGSGNASAAQQQQAAQAMQLQKQMYDQNREDMSPWLQAGRGSLASLLQMVNGGYDTSQIANDPGYQFRMQQGQQALERSAAARGSLQSGGTLKSLARYSQGLASDEYTNRFNRLASLAGVGQTAAQNMGAQGSNYANSMGGLYGAMGNAQAAGAMGGANAFSGAMGGLGNMAMMYGMHGMYGGNGMGGGIPTQGGSTGYTSGYSPAGGFGLNYGY